MSRLGRKSILIKDLSELLNANFMKGLCHICNSSNVDVIIGEGIVTCENCLDKSKS
jgi:hypothetical protein